MCASGSGSVFFSFYGYSSQQVIDAFTDDVINRVFVSQGGVEDLWVRDGP